jgi:hypothetical protein
MSLQRILINTALTANGFKSVCNLAAGEIEGAVQLENYFGALSGGNQMALVSVQVGAVQAAATIVSAATAVAAETMTVCNVTLTAKASGAVAANGEFNISATPATQAANIAAAINAVASLSGKVTAAVTSGGTVTVTSVVPGLVGNGLQIAESLTGVTVTAFAAGSDGTSYSLDLR